MGENQTQNQENNEKTAVEIKNLVRGLNPIMGAYSFLEGKKIKFWKVETLTDEELFEEFPIYF